MEWDSHNPSRNLASFTLTCIEDAARLNLPQVFAGRRVLHRADGKMLLNAAGLPDTLAVLKAGE